MAICHVKNAELEPQFQKYKGRVVLRGDTVKDDSGAFAVFTEQGSSASQMMGAKVMDIIARLPDCDGQASDAVSAFSPVKMEDAPRLLQNSKVRMSRYMDTSSTTLSGQKHEKYEDPSGSSWEKFVRTPTCWSLVGKAISRKFCWNLKLEKVPNWEMPVCS